MPAPTWAPAHPAATQTPVDVLKYRGRTSGRWDGGHPSKPVSPGSPPPSPQKASLQHTGHLLSALVHSSFLAKQDTRPPDAGLPTTAPCPSVRGTEEEEWAIHTTEQKAGTAPQTKTPAERPRARPQLTQLGLCSRGWGTPPRELPKDPQRNAALPARAEPTSSGQKARQTGCWAPKLRPARPPHSGGLGQLCAENQEVAVQLATVGWQRASLGEAGAGRRQLEGSLVHTPPLSLSARGCGAP